MDKLKILEAKVAELDSKIIQLTSFSLKESELLDLFLKIEKCADFESLQDLSKKIGKMQLSKHETLLFSLAARIRQNSLMSENIMYAMEKHFGTEVMQ